MEKNNISRHDTMIDRLINLSHEEFLDLGSDGLSYIKYVGNQDGHDIYALHAANGSHIATGQDIGILKSIAGQNELAAMALQ